MGKRLVAIVAAVGLLGLPVVPASAHYEQPPADLEASPALVQVKIVFNFQVTIHDMKMAKMMGSYDVKVPGPTGTGAIFNPSGSVVTTFATAWPSPTAARITAANMAFNQFSPRGWTGADLEKKQSIPGDMEMTMLLHACYTPGNNECVVKHLGRSKSVVFNTVPRREVPVFPTRLDNGLTVLRTDPATARESTSTVALADEMPPESPFVGLGYDASGNIKTVTGTLQGGSLTKEQTDNLASTFVAGGEGVMLLDPASKGTVLAVVVRNGQGAAQLVPAGKALAAAGYEAERGVFQASVDEALGYYWAKHYTHAIPLLERTTKLLPDKVLLTALDKSKELKGSAADMSMPGEADAAPTETSTWSSAWWLVPLVVVGLALVGGVALLLLRRRRQSQVQASDADATAAVNGDEGVDPDFDDDYAFEPERGSPPSVLSDVQPGHRPSVPPADVRSSEPGTTVIEVGDSAPGRTGYYCPGCGVGLVAGDRFCYNCGTRAR